MISASSRLNYILLQPVKSGYGISDDRTQADFAIHASNLKRRQ